MSSSFTALVQSSIASSSFLSFRRERAVILHMVVIEGAQKLRARLQNSKRISHARSPTVTLVLGHWESLYLSGLRPPNLKLVSSLSNGSQAHLSARIKPPLLFQVSAQ